MDSNANFTDLINLYPLGVLIISDNEIIDVNDASVLMLRTNTKENVLGKSLNEIIFNDDLSTLLNYLNSISDKEKNFRKKIIRINCFDGIVRRFEISASFVIFNQNKALLLYLSDIEDYLQEVNDNFVNKEKLNAVVSALPDLIFVINDEKVFIDYYANNYSALLTEPLNFWGKDIFQVLPEYLAKITSEKIDKVFSSGEKEEYEYYLDINNERKYFFCYLVKKSKDEVLAVIRDISSFKRTEIALDEELKFNSIIRSLSIKFINCNLEEIDFILDDALSEVGKYFGVDRVNIFEFDFPNRKMSNTYEWCAEDVTPEIENSQNMDIDIIEGFVNLMINKKIFIVDDVRNFENENIRNILEPRGILSIIIHPIFIENECFGYVEFDSVKSLRKFSEKEINFLDILANFLSSVFQKIKTEKELNYRKKELENSRIAYLNIIDDLRKENEERKRIETELKVSELKFRSYIEQTQGVIFVITRSGTFSYVSTAAKDILGEEPDYLIGKHYIVNVHKEDIKKVKSQLKQLIQTKKPIKSVPVRIKHKNGSFKWIIAQAGPILNADCTIKEIIGVAVDVNELMEIKQQLSIAELRYKSLFENQIESYSLQELILDEDGNPVDYKFIDVNKAFLEITGLNDKKQVIGKTLLEVWPEIEKDWIDIYGRITLTDGRETFEKFSPYFNKTFLINVYSQGGVTFALSFFDITDRKRAEITKKIQLNIANAIIQEDNLSKLLITIKDELSQLIDTTNFFVAKYDESKKLFTNLIFIDEKDESNYTWSSEDSLSGYVVNKKNPVLLYKENIIEIEKSLGKELLGTNPEIWVGVPLLLKRKCLGIMVLQSYSNKNAYDQSTVDLLQTIASQLAVFIEQREFESQIRLLSTAIDQSSLIVMITDKEKKIQFVNNKFLQITKFSVDEVIGSKPSIIKSGYHKKDFYREMWRVLSAGKDWIGEILNLDKFGNQYWVNAVISPIIDAKGTITNYIAIEEDITERKKLYEKIEVSEKQLRTTWDNSIDGMRLTDENGIIIDVNQALCNLYGTEREKFIGKPFYYLVKNYSGGGLKKFSENILSGNIQKIKEYTFDLENGKVLNVEVTNSIIQFDDGKKYLFTVFRDISEKKKMINDLIIAKEKAEEMNRIKSQFFAYMSHELRTPFMGILGYTELLRDKVSDEEGNKFLDGITRSSNRMIETLTNILDLSKFEAGKTDTKLELIDPVFLILDICEHFKYQANKKRISFESNIDLPNSLKIFGNDKLFRSILNNLFSNAIKFTSKGNVTVNSFIKNSHFIIEVIDTGIGIPKEKQELIFDEFRQVSEGHSRVFEGTGLGLSIAKKFTEILGGKIEVESELEKGSTFRIKIPLREMN